MFYLCQEYAKLSSWQAKGWLLWRISNIKYTLICLMLFLVITWFHVCYFIVFLSSLQCRKEKINILKPWMNRCAQTFDWYCKCYSLVLSIMCSLKADRLSWCGTGEVHCTQTICTYLMCTYLKWIVVWDSRIQFVVSLHSHMCYVVFRPHGGAAQPGPSQAGASGGEVHGCGQRQHRRKQRQRRGQGDRHTRYYAITISHINTKTHTCRFLLIPDTPKRFFKRQAHENDTLHTLLNSYVWLVCMSRVWPTSAPTTAMAVSALPATKSQRWDTHTMQRRCQWGTGLA